MLPDPVFPAGLAPPEELPEPEPVFPDPVLPDPVLPDPVEPDAVELVVEVVVVLVVEVGVFELPVAVGTVSAGAPEVSAEGEPPLPQAASEIASNTTTVRQRKVRRPFTSATPSTKRIHTPATVGAVVEVLLHELVAPVTEAEVLDRPGELGGRWSQGHELADDLELLARVPIDVDPVGLRLDDHLPAGGGRPHAVLLAGPHPHACYRRSLTACETAGWAEQETGRDPAAGRRGACWLG